MSDEDLLRYCGLEDYPAEAKAKFLATLSTEKREMIERMGQVEFEIALWQQGLGPKPAGVILCHDHAPTRKE